MYSRNTLGVTIHPKRDSANNIRRTGQKRAHDMELSMATSGISGPPIHDSYKSKERQDFKKGTRPFEKTPKKESMTVKATSVKFMKKNDDQSEKPKVPQGMGQRKLTLKEIQEKEYPFSQFRCFQDFRRLNQGGTY